MASSGGQRAGGGAGWWGLAAAAGILAALLWPSASLTVDEAVYRWMAAAATDGRLGVDNGVGLGRSPGLLLTLPYGSFLVEGPLGLTGKFPPLSALLAAPAVWALGEGGQIALGVWSLALLLWGTAALGAALGLGEQVGRRGAALLLVGSFAPVHALIPWPQVWVAALLVWSWVAALRGAAPAAGALFGVAVGVRLDAVAGAPLLAASLALGGGGLRACATRGVAAALAALPPLLLVLGLNAARFGVPTVFSYGASHGEGAAEARALPLLLGAAVWGGLAVVAEHKRWGWALVGAGLAALTWVGGGIAGWQRCLALGVDLALLPAGPLEPGMLRGLDGAVYYPSLGVKKALLQSAPWLPLALLAPSAAVGVRARVHLLGPAVVLGLGYGITGWHGGMGTDLRYLLPALPGLCLLLAATIPAAAGPWALAGAAVAVGGAGALVVGGAEGAAWAARDGAMWAALLGVAAAVGARVGSGRVGRGALGGALGLTVGTAAVLAAADVGVYHRARGEVAALTRAIEGQVPPGATIFTLGVMESVDLYGRRGWFVLDGGVDRMQTTPRVLEAHARAGRPLWALVPSPWLERARGVLEGAGFTVAAGEALRPGLLLLPLARGADRPGVQGSARGGDSPPAASPPPNPAGAGAGAGEDLP